MGVCETSGQEVALWHLSTIAEAHTSSCTKFFAVENEGADVAETCVYSCLIDILYTVDGRNPANHLMGSLYIPGGAGFLP